MRVAATGSPAAIASAAARPNVSALRDGTSATPAVARSRSSSSSGTRPANRTSAPAARARSSPASGPSPATTSGRPAARQASIARSTPFSGASREVTSAGPSGANRGSAAIPRTGCGTTRDLVAERGAEREQAVAGEGARDDDRVGLGRPSAAARARAPRRRPPTRRAPPRQFRRTAGSVSRPWQRVHSSPRVKQTADRADEPVVVEVQDDLRARLARRGERAPAELGQEVVRVDDAGVRPPHGRGDLVGIEPAAQQPGRGAPPPGGRGVPREHLGVLPQVLAHEPDEVVDGPLLAPGRAVAVVEEEDHDLRKPRLRAWMRPSSYRPGTARRTSTWRCAASARRPARSAPTCSSSTTGPPRRPARSPSATARAYVAHPASRGLNAARNTGLDETTAELVCFVDDDVGCGPGWLRALVDGAARNPDHGCLTGPVRAVFEGHRAALLRPRGRRRSPSSTSGRRSATRRTPGARTSPCGGRPSSRSGASTRRLGLYGDEQEWEARLLAAGGRIRWLPDAALDHRRAGDDARVSSLARAARFRGRAARREDVAKGTPPSLGPRAARPRRRAAPRPALPLRERPDPHRALGREDRGGAAPDARRRRGLPLRRERDGRRAARRRPRVGRTPSLDRRLAPRPVVARRAGACSC